MANQPNIWVLEDDPGSQFVYEQILGDHYHLDFFGKMEDFRSSLAQEEKNLPDLIVADIHLPDESFLNFLDTEEANIFHHFPFIVVSSYDDISALRRCFEKGALDFITKPFNKTELMVKIERILSADWKPRILDNKTIDIDQTSFTITHDGKKTTSLTSKEFQIVTMIFQTPNHTQTREEILARIWGNVKVGSNTLDVHLFNLRRKLEPIGLKIVYIPPNFYRLLGAEAKIDPIKVDTTR